VRIKADLPFAELLEEQVGYASLIAAAQVLARLANERWLYHVAEAWTNPLPPSAVPPGVTRDVLLLQVTSYGLIVIGGSGPNTYELDKGIGLIIDVGGNDLYRGMIAASTDEDQGNAVVIDLNGDDTYHGAPLGLATGRLGVGLLIDHDGDDVYQLDMGSGGAGFGGLGIFVRREKQRCLYRRSPDPGRSHWRASASCSMRQGDDRYGSSGPLYNGGVAWDSSVSLMIDAGNRCRERTRHLCLRALDRSWPSRLCKLGTLH